MEERFDALLEQHAVIITFVNWPKNRCPNPRYVEEEEDEHIERVSCTDLDLPSIHDDYFNDD